MAGVLIEKLNVKINGFELKDVTLDLKDGELMVILGPTGAGKTLLLETIAGFNLLNSGRIFMNRREISILPPEKRNIGIIFQDYALFPHLNVKENIVFGTRYRKVENVKEKFERLIDFLKLGTLLGRMPHTLSGGEKQRVAIARALIVEPELMLFDEPLSAIDEQLRAGLREELRSIVKERNITSIYVTHDQVEAAMIGDRIGIIEKGKILQIGTKEKIFYHPATPRVAEFTGVENMLSGTVKNQEQGMTLIDVDGCGIEAVSPFSVGEKVIACIRSEDVAVSLEEQQSIRSSVRNRLRGSVTKINHMGPIVKVTIDCGIPLIAAITKRSCEELGLAQGKSVTASFKAVAVHVISP